jgi:hypothetical protein
MSNTYAPERPTALDNSPWIEVDGDWAEALEQLVASGDRGIVGTTDTRQASMVVLPMPAFVEDTHDEDGLRDVLEFKNGAMTMTQAEREAFDALTRERSPRLAKPLPLD